MSSPYSSRPAGYCNNSSIDRPAPVFAKNGGRETTGLYICRWYLAATDGNVPVAFGLAEVLRCFEPSTGPVSSVQSVGNMLLGTEIGRHIEIHHGVGDRCRARVFWAGDRYWATNYARFGAALRCDRRRAKTILAGLDQRRLIASVVATNQQEAATILLPKAPPIHDFYLRPLTHRLRAFFIKGTGIRVPEHDYIVPDNFDHRNPGEYQMIAVKNVSETLSIGVYPGWYESRTRQFAMNRNPEAVDTYTWAKDVDPSKKFRDESPENQELLRGLFREEIQRRPNPRSPCPWARPSAGRPSRSVMGTTARRTCSPNSAMTIPTTRARCGATNGCGCPARPGGSRSGWASAPTT
jgi:hypothetical protein